MAPKERDEQFFATLEGFSKEFASAIKLRWDCHTASLKGSKRHERMRRSWAMYYSRSRDGDWDDTEIQAGGSLGELTMIRPNEYRNLVQHEVNLVTQASPRYECRAVSTNSKSLSRAILGNGLLDYYLRVHHLDDLRVKRAEVALVLGESFLVVAWDANAGEKFGVKDVPQRDAKGEKMTGPDGQALTKKAPTYHGELTFQVRTPYEVAYDPLSKDLQRPRWTISHEPANRWDLAALYPDKRAEILAQPRWSEVTKEWGVSSEYDHDDYIAVFRVGVESCPACDEGRASLLLTDGETVLEDAPLVDDRIGVFRLAASDVLFQAGGYTNNFDVLPIAEAFQAQASTIFSNHQAFGGQIIAAPKGSGVKPHQLGRGLSLLIYEPYSDVDGRPMQPPQPLQLLSTPEEVFTFLDWLQKAGERYSGIHAVMRGEVNASDSGAKTALQHATAQQFSNQFHRNLSRSDEDVGTYVIGTLRVRAKTKRVAVLAGRFQSFSEQTYEAADLDEISRVTVQAADPSRDTYMGRKELAEVLLKMPPEDRQKYIEILNTGRYELLTEGPEAQMLLIRRENEQLRDPEKPEPLVAPSDDHWDHIDKHRCEYDDPAIREAPDSKVRDRVKRHIDWHIAALTPGHERFAGPQMLAVCKQQPLPPLMPPGGPPPPAGAQARPPGAPPPGGPPRGPGPRPGPGGPPAPPSNGTQAPGMPRMPKPPTNPLTGERAPVPVLDPPAITQG